MVRRSMMAVAAMLVTHIRHLFAAMMAMMMVPGMVVMSMVMMPAMMVMGVHSHAAEVRRRSAVIREA
jgi:hypothetical protein